MEAPKQDKLTAGASLVLVRRWLSQGTLGQDRRADGMWRWAWPLHNLAPPPDIYRRARWLFLVFSLASALALIVASIRGALLQSWLDVFPAIALAVLSVRWVGEYRGRRWSGYWDLLEALGILAVGVATDPIDILLLAYARLSIRALGTGGAQLAWVLGVYLFAFGGSVLVRSQVSALGTPLEQLIFLGSGFPLVTFFMSNLGTLLIRDRELSRHLESEQALRISEANFRLLFTANPQPMWVFDAETLRFLEVNTAATEHYGYSRDEFLAMRTTDIRPPDEVDRFHNELQQHQYGLFRSTSWRHVLKDGRIIVVDIAAHDLEFGGRPAILVLAQDVTERLELDERLRHQAFHDALTSLANRALFYDRVEHAVARGTRSDTGFAVLFIDLDNFKAINDSVGHNAGDAVLLEVARRISRAIRPSDTAARLGGDEFAVLIEPVKEGGNAIPIAERIAESLNAPIQVEGDAWFVSGSIGIAFSGDAGETVDAILRSADVAMYNAKKRGRAQFAIFEPEMHASVLAKSMLEGELRQALAKDELVLFFQPEIDLRRNIVTGVEALVRWRHPRRGLLGPGEFIPQAEETQLITELDSWVLAHAAAQMQAWKLTGIGGITVGVNISGREFTTPALAERIASIVAETGLPPRSVELEVTESVAFEAENARSTLESLRKMGFRVAIDDFGVGFSMLGRLQELPVDRLKIDRSFVEKITFGEDEAPIVTGIIAMAHSLRLKVVAEGIETTEQLAFLRRSGCDEGQGYRLGRPMRGEDIEPMLRRSAADHQGGQVKT